MRLAKATAVTCAVIVLLTGCDRGEAPGIVTEKGGSGKRHHLTVQEPDGTLHRFRVRRPAFRSCQVGDRWPDCAN